MTASWLPDFDLERFVAAQDAGGAFDHALAEVRAGRKTGHWMWFVFPQLRGLGFSRMAEFYGIASLEEARAYLAHPVLGPRLLSAAAAAAEADAASATALMGSVDAQKLRSSATLFLRATSGEDAAPFSAVLDRWFGGVADTATDALL